MSEERGPITFDLGANGVESRQSVRETRNSEYVATLRDARERGLAVLSIGPKQPPGFSLATTAIELDADACRHLAKLLEAKASEIDARESGPREPHAEGCAS